MYGYQIANFPETLDHIPKFKIPKILIKYFQVLSYCVPAVPYDGRVETEVSMVVKLGKPLDIIRLLQMSWEDRLRVGSNEFNNKGNNCL